MSAQNDGTGKDDIMFTIHDPSMYDEIVLARNPKPSFKTHVVVPIKKIGDPGKPEFVAMKLKE